MSKIAILSDVHANLQALEAVLTEAAVSGAGQIMFAGDLVGYGASPGECVRRAMSMGSAAVCGNHDVEAISFWKAGMTDGKGGWMQDPYMAGIILAAARLRKGEAEWLQGLPWLAKVDGGALLIHSSLNEPQDWNYIEDPESAAPSLDLMRGRKRHVLFCGHTHVQRVFTDPDDARKLEWLGERKFRIPGGLATVVTVGSVGQPREADGDRRAGWVLWDPVARVLEFRRTDYDFKAASAAMRKEKLPSH